MILLLEVNNYMNPILIALIIYITGVVVSAFIIRFLNAKEKYRCECVPPAFCFLSWICFLTFIIVYTIGFLAENTEDFFNYKYKKITLKNKTKL